MIATVDIGLKNLAICIMSNTEGQNSKTIHLWDVFNLLDDNQNHICNEIKKDGSPCMKSALFKYQSTKLQLDNSNGQLTSYTCKTHFPKNIQMGNSNMIKIKKVKDFLLQDIAEKVVEKMNELLQTHNDLFRSVEKISIELQPKVNNKMKFVSHIIYGKFVEYNIGRNIPVRFVRASQKLKAYKGPEVACKLKGPYAKRKFLAVEYTKWFLENTKVEETQKWKTQFLNNKKKDDMSDVFLMCINELYPQKQKGKKKLLKAGAQRNSAKSDTLNVNPHHTLVDNGAL
uniref:Mitochondrial resolvase Ydc2 catalytic domain-containing protein n=1 Tax=viral metagenome TaxID=1070528 RepID=A0A6C0DZF9_9ZZZZ